MINFLEIVTGESWELFARDFLAELGLSVESPPDRGPDHGKDMLLQEDLRGHLHNSSFRWLVSCKHNAKGGSAVSEADEQNILERVESFRADGFLGFYSTVPTANLNTRMRTLREQGKIKDYRFFDHKLIENHLIRVGYSHLVFRYFPESYKRLRPLHAVVGEYEPLSCAVCGKDLLEALFRESYRGMIVFAHPLAHDDDSVTRITELAWVCKNECDQVLERRFAKRELYTGWEDISDLVIPAFYLQFWFSTMNSIQNGTRVFSPLAFEQLKHFLYCLGQKVLQETTPKERERLHVLDEISFLQS